MKKYFICYIVLTYSIHAASQVREVKSQENVNANNQQLIRPNEVVSQKAKFVLTCSEANLSGIFQPVTNYVPITHFKEVIINHRLCNNNPNAFILVTPVRTKPLSYSLYYDQDSQRWKIRIETNGVTDTHTGSANPADKNPIMVTVLDYSPDYLSKGDKFNILIDNE